MGERVKWDAARVQDDRVQCQGCGRRMVPRLITYQGSICRTVCPFCTETYEDFTPRFPRMVLVIIGIGVVFFVLCSFGSV
jgi:cold shock protein